MSHTTTADISDAFKGLAVIAAIVGVLGFILVLAFENKAVRSKCLALGYPEARYDRHLFEPNNFYCYKRVSGTDTLIEVTP